VCVYVCVFECVSLCATFTTTTIQILLDYMKFMWQSIYKKNKHKQNDRLADTQ